MFDQSARIVLAEDEPDGPYPRRALRMVDPPRPVRVDVAGWLADRKPRSAERPIWLRTTGLDNHPVDGLLHAWVRTTNNDWFGIVSVELRSRRGQLRFALPYQLVPGGALHPTND